MAAEQTFPNYKCSICDCQAFQSFVQRPRQCAGCSHTWSWHVSSRLSKVPIEMSPAQSTITDVIGMILYGSSAVPVNLKILLDRLIQGYLPTNLAFIFHMFGWNIADYNRSYKILDQFGNVIVNWVQPNAEETFIIVKQFLQYPITCSIALNMLQNQLNGMYSSQNAEIPTTYFTSTTTYQPILPLTLGEIWRLCGNGLPQGNNSNTVSQSSDNTTREEHPENDETPVDVVSSGDALDVVLDKHTLNAPPENSEITLVPSCDSSNQSNATVNHAGGFKMEEKCAQRLRKRAFCDLCNKSFYDNGALKVHTSSVHLGEKHKCWMPGCNLWFNSKRSRNRHSSNPNPRLHQNHSLAKIIRNSDSVPLATKTLHESIRDVMNKREKMLPNNDTEVGTSMESLNSARY